LGKAEKISEGKRERELKRFVAKNFAVEKG
jgi:hypothetical protein